jgi:LacI family transcriptional regulator
MARELNYLPNLVARSLVTRQSASIAMIITSTRNPIFPEIAGGVGEILREEGYSLSLVSTFDDEEIEAKELAGLRARGVDGIIISSALANSANICRLVDSGFPVVSVLRRVYNCTKLDYVIVDNVQGGYLAAEHLIKLGHTRIGVIKGPANTSTGIERFEGAVKAMQDHGVPLPEHLIFAGDFFKQCGYMATHHFLRLPRTQRPSAIYACNDDMAMGAFEAILDVGLKIPEDMALVGFNNVEATSLRTIEITTIDQRPHEMGRLAALILMEKLHARSPLRVYRKVLDARLIIRRSCGFHLAGHGKSRLISDSF